MTHHTTQSIETEVEHHRSNAEKTLDALRERMSAEGVMHEVGSLIGIEDARVSVEAIGRQVKAHPIAFGLMAAGLALFAARKASPSQDVAIKALPKPHHDQATLPYGDAGAHQPDDAVAYTVHDTPTHHARGLTAAYEGAKDTAGGLAQQARQHTQDNPLLVGGLALTASAVLGAILPRSHAEDRWIGPARDRLAEEAHHLSAGAQGRATQAVQAVYTKALDVARDEGILPTGSGDGHHLTAQPHRRSAHDPFEAASSRTVN